MFMARVPLKTGSASAAGRLEATPATQVLLRGGWSLSFLIQAPIILGALTIGKGRRIGAEPERALPHAVPRRRLPRRHEPAGVSAHRCAERGRARSAPRAAR